MPPLPGIAISRTTTSHFDISSQRDEKKSQENRYRPGGKNFPAKRHTPQIYIASLLPSYYISQLFPKLGDDQINQAVKHMHYVVNNYSAAVRKGRKIKRFGLEKIYVGQNRRKSVVENQRNL
jgi:hypothetical protein